jgi:hypothetical protein
VEAQDLFNAGIEVGQSLSLCESNFFGRGEGGVDLGLKTSVFGGVFEKVIEKG